MQITNPLGLPVIDDVTGFAALHEVTAPEQVGQLAADMADCGWRGAPLVVRRDHALLVTGVHRQAAAQHAGIAVPGVDLEELLDACGIDLWARDEELGGLGWDLTLVELINNEIPGDVVEAYGLDLH